MRVSSIWALAIVLLVEALLGAGSSTAAETIALVSGSDYAPYADQGLPGGGFVTEIVAQAFKIEGLTATIDFVPWKRGYEAVKEGRYAATYPYVATPERQAEMLLSEPLYAVPTYLVFRKGRERPFAGPESLRGLTLCQPVGFALPATLAQAVSAGTIKTEQPPQSGLCNQMLARDRVDFMLASPCTYKYMIEPSIGVETVIGREVVEVNPLYLLMPRSDPDSAARIQAFNRGLARLHATGEWDRIVQRRLGRDGLGCPPLPPSPPSGAAIR